MEKGTVGKSLGITLQTIFLVLGQYFFFRIFRNNLYYPWINSIEGMNPVINEGLLYLGHVIFLAGLLLYFLLEKEDRALLKGAAFKPKKDIFMLVIGLVFGFCMNGFSILMAYLHGDIDMVKVSFEPMLLIFLFVCVFIQSSTEELQSRLWGYGRIKAKAAMPYAVIGSSLAFALSHMLNTGITITAILSIFLDGVLLALLLELSGSLWACCAYHAAWNFTQNCIFGLPNSGNAAVITMMEPTYTKESFFYDPVFGVEGAWSVVALHVAAILIMLAIYKAGKRKQQEKA